MARALTNGIALEYSIHGDGEPMLLICGLGAQLVYWPPDFVRSLAERGYAVAIFDNRDVGLSTKFGDPNANPYDLRDMAEDTVGLLDHLGIERTHVVGLSMGGMIAQLIAVHHPQRVLSLCSVASRPGWNSDEPVPTMDLTGISTRDSFIQAMVERNRAARSPGFAFDEPATRERAALTWNRDRDVQGGFVRHAAAVLSTGPIVDALPRIAAPTVVIHGDSDPVIALDGGRLTADAIPDARLLVIPGLAHELPRGAWPTIVDAICTNASRAHTR